MIAFSDDLFSRFTSWEVKDLFGTNNPSEEKRPLDLESVSRSNLGSLALSDPLSAPILNLYSDGPLELGDLNNLLGFTSSIEGIREASTTESELLARLRYQSGEGKKLLESFKTQTQYFLSALKKIEVYAKGGTVEEGLTQNERKAVVKYYDLWYQLKERGIDVMNQLMIRSRDTGKVSQLSNPSRSMSSAEMKNLLSKIKFEEPSMQVLSDPRKFVDGSEAWTTCGQVPGQCPNLKDWVGNSENWGFDPDWDKNPWSDFFINKDEWQAFWKQRFELKQKYFKEWEKTRYWSWDGGRFCSVNGVELFEGCYSATQGELAQVVDKANANISLQVGMKVLLWMGYPLEGDRPKQVVTGKGVVPERSQQSLS
ncbi:hypothetical protein MHLP_03410 [Candidatus Mycoplasma haematolamae str. Purdue]|uniref:Uncharacterized protein n=1 Tax=Mycoplasma haematolamae (strain Purdue) TaxID=1212765 RepID=I7C6U5_MYCHA|nr:hypothetical protein [Candidatus Mycoplasma haematolamae]AFO52262.1 hypothetical protein MHLP_03410 [Candidatus Mycoplasma haematolamae str. Purdue]